MVVWLSSFLLQLWQSSKCPHVNLIFPPAGWKRCDEFLFLMSILSRRNYSCSNENMAYTRIQKNTTTLIRFNSTDTFTMIIVSFLFCFSNCFFFFWFGRFPTGNYWEFAHLSLWYCNKNKITKNLPYCNERKRAKETANENESAPEQINYILKSHTYIPRERGSGKER